MQDSSDSAGIEGGEPQSYFAWTNRETRNVAGVTRVVAYFFRVSSLRDDDDDDAAVQAGHVRGHARPAS